ncbi:MAG: molybdopterin converting factor subunit 1 [Hahellaceae bacterium]|nr:molybdopterin converting factor subunit 1 [Hahellaceae bacterium]MCP5168327.1 molybdopterin converting factor subunit 1 [Hahellaceae bacterium]
MKILFFASLRERLQCAEVTLSDTESLQTGRDILNRLIARGEPWQSALQSGQLLMAVNQEMVPLDTQVNADDEIAFFPPVTGG